MAMLVMLSILTACNTLPSENLPVAPGHLMMERVTLPGQFKKEDGSFYTANLDAIIIRPDDDQIRPLAIINHGFVNLNHSGVFADELKNQTIEFARRGWIAVTFSRRGYGRSQGPFVEGIAGRDESSYVSAGLRSAADIREVIRLMKEKNYVDASKIISVGISGGGFSSIALTAEPPSGLIAAINFAGGRSKGSGDALLKSYDTLAKATGEYGKTSRVPMLWIYVENDHVIPLAAGRKMYAAFTEAGGMSSLLQRQVSLISEMRDIIYLIWGSLFGLLM